MSKKHGLKALSEREKDGLLKKIKNCMSYFTDTPKYEDVLKLLYNNFNVFYLTDVLIGLVYENLAKYTEELESFHESLQNPGDEGEYTVTIGDMIKLFNHIENRILLFNYKLHYVFNVGNKEMHAYLKVNITFSNRCVSYEVIPLVDDCDIVKVYRVPTMHTNCVTNDITDYYYLDDFIDNDQQLIDDIRRDFIATLVYPICSNADILVNDRDILIKDIFIKLTNLDYTFKEIIASDEIFRTIKEVHTDDPESILSYDTDWCDEEAFTEEEVSEVLDLNSDFECPCNSQSVIKMDSDNIKDKRTKSIVEFVKDVIPDETFLAMAVVGQDYFDDDPSGIVKTTSNTIKKIIVDNIKYLDDSTEFRVHRVIRITDNSYIHDFISITYDNEKYTVTPYVYNTLTGELDKKNQYGINDVNNFLHDIDDLVNTWAEFWHKITSNDMSITVAMVEKE